VESAPVRYTHHVLIWLRVSLLIALGTLFLTACAAPPSTPVPTATPTISPSATPIDIESETSQVYTLALESWCGSRDVFLEPTTNESIDGTIDTDDYEAFAEDVPELERSTLNNYVLANRRREPMPHVDYGRVVEFMTQTEFIEMYDIEPGGDEWWDHFHEEYPNGCGYALLSGIGFNTEATQALVNLYASTGSLSCIVEHLVMQKEDSRWRITHELVQSIC
jgi:hypothetical protein